MYAILLLLLAISLSACSAKEDTTSSTTPYPSKFDRIDVHEILTNDRLYMKYYNCLVNKGKCAPDGVHLKEIIPDALKTGCSKCSEAQKKNTETVIRHIIEKRPQDFDVLEKLYDPEGLYKTKYTKEAEQHGIELNAKKNNL